MSNLHSMRWWWSFSIRPTHWVGFLWYSSLKRKSTGVSIRTETSFWFRANQSLLLLLNAACLAKHINLIDPTGMRTHDLPHSTRDVFHYTTDVVPGITLLIVITVIKKKKKKSKNKNKTKLICNILYREH